MIHKFGECCVVDDNPYVHSKLVGIEIGFHSDWALITSPQDARALAKFLIDWAEKVEGKNG